MGFAKAFNFMNISQLSKEISRPFGLLWLLTGFLYITTVILFLIKKEPWPLLGISAVILSQILIFTVWKDAKFGTLPNTIMLIICIVAVGSNLFNAMVKKESSEILQNIPAKNLSKISKENIKQLPEIVKKWIQNSGTMGKEEIVSVWLKQKGELKTKPKSNWMDFTAEQYFNIVSPAFIWTTQVDFMPMVNMVGRDKLINGQGEMLIKLANVIPVVNEGNNKKINSGAMVRFLAEMVWFPSAALNDYINWEPIDTNMAKATFTCNGKSVSGIYEFSKEGQFKSFVAYRYYGGKNNSKLEKWKIIALDHKEIGGLYIPNKCKVVWKLENGDFNWLNLEIINIEYNIKQVHY